MSEPVTTSAPAEKQPQPPQQQKKREEPQAKPVPQSHLQHMVDASIVSFLDREVCVYTTDDSMFVGELNGFDSINGVTLTKALQRWLCEGKYAERQVGTIYLAGHNVIMIGTRDDQYLNELKEVPIDELFNALKEQRIRKGTPAAE